VGRCAIQGLLLLAAAGCAVRETPAPAPQPAPSAAPAPVPEPVVVVREAPPPTPAETEARQLAELVAYASRVAGMGADDQRRELTAATQEYARDTGLRARLRLALLLGQPGTSVHDDARAAALLEPVAPAAGAAAAALPLRQFAALLYGQVSDRLREQKRGAQLKEQIEGLRAIERSLMERERGKK
jgi:hypothetical protein